MYAGDKNITEFEGDHNSQRPEFFYDSAAIFFHTVLMCETYEKPIKKPKERSARSDKPSSPVDLRLPEFDSTNFRNMSDELKRSESVPLYKLDDRINYLMNRNRKEELKMQLRSEDRETKQAMLQSICTYTEEREKDDNIIETLQRIGFFRQLSAVGEFDLDSENLLNDDSPELVKDTSNTDQITNLRKVLSSSNSDAETEPKSM